MGGLLHLVQRGGAWAGCDSAQSPPRCTKCNSRPINGQCTKIILFDVAVWLPVGVKGLTEIIQIDLRALKISQNYKILLKSDSKNLHFSSRSLCRLAVLLSHAKFR